MQLEPRALPGQAPQEQVQRGQVPPRRVLPEPEPWVLRGPEPERPDGMLREQPEPWGRLQVRGQLPWQRLHRGRRREASSRRGPQWWKRRSERIRPIPAVWLLHLWK